MPESKRHPARRPQQRNPKSGHRNPAGSSSSTSSSSSRPAAPPASPARAWLVRHSAGPLVMVHRAPTFVVAIALAVTLVAGLALPWAWAGLLLLALGAFLGWLLALSWPIINGAGRTMRGLAVLALLVTGILRLLGTF